MKRLLTAFCLLLTVSLAHADTYTLTWTDNSGNDPKINDAEDGFRVYRILNSLAPFPTPPGTPFATVGPNITTYVDNTPAVPSTCSTTNTYRYVVTAFNKTGESGYTNEVSKALSSAACPPNIPGAPSNLVGK